VWQSDQIKDRWKTWEDNVLNTFYQSDPTSWSTLTTSDRWSDKVSKVAIVALCVHVVVYIFLHLTAWTQNSPWLLNKHMNYISLLKLYESFWSLWKAEIMVLSELLICIWLVSANMNTLGWPKLWSIYCCMPDTSSLRYITEQLCNNLVSSLSVANIF